MGCPTDPVQGFTLVTHSKPLRQLIHQETLSYHLPLDMAYRPLPLAPRTVTRINKLPTVLQVTRGSFPRGECPSLVCPDIPLKYLVGLLAMVALMERRQGTHLSVTLAFQACHPLAFRAPLLCLAFPPQLLLKKRPLIHSLM
jgi:hypothetical protein